MRRVEPPWPFWGYAMSCWYLRAKEDRAMWSQKSSALSSYSIIMWSSWRMVFRKFLTNNFLCRSHNPEMFQDMMWITPSSMTNVGFVICLFLGKLLFPMRKMMFEMLMLVLIFLLMRELLLSAGCHLRIPLSNFHHSYLLHLYGGEESASLGWVGAID